MIFFSPKGKWNSTSYIAGLGKYHIQCAGCEGWVKYMTPSTSISPWRSRGLSWPNIIGRIFLPGTLMAHERQGVLNPRHLNCFYSGHEQRKYQCFTLLVLREVEPTVTIWLWTKYIYRYMLCFLWSDTAPFTLAFYGLFTDARGTIIYLLCRFNSKMSCYKYQDPQYNIYGDSWPFYVYKRDAYTWTKCLHIEMRSIIHPCIILAAQGPLSRGHCIHLPNHMVHFITPQSQLQQDLFARKYVTESTKVVFQYPFVGLHNCVWYNKAYTVKPVYNDHLMGYFFAFWSSSRWPLAT